MNTAPAPAPAVAPRGSARRRDGSRAAALVMAGAPFASGSPRFAAMWNRWTMSRSWSWRCFRPKT